MKSTNDGRDEFFSGRIHDEVEKVRICREAVGDDFDFVLEVHRGMTVPEAISFAREVEPYRPWCWKTPSPRTTSTPWRKWPRKPGFPLPPASDSPT